MTCTDCTRKEIKTNVKKDELIFTNVPANICTVCNELNFNFRDQLIMEHYSKLERVNPGEIDFADVELAYKSMTIENLIVNSPLQ
ncbi:MULTISPECIES: hypothetical protein [Bacillus cereus group]|uniref:Recombinase RecR n=3 Tax=Bacillus cereus group TaxID=86661 RepID=A0A9W7PZI8_BACCE|nr:MULTISPECIES: hypothetical protein [Bacillus cereus group]ALL11616.1 recombinase RecR [Bacillus thuringiensis]ALL21755.1 recombinase RecR [Bacillus thuringiensis]EJR72824.1 hypothetical protein IK9_05599 [Bacillus cereus VD166]KAA6449214.1 recombinase RecR [Bacillus cereus]MEB9673969.1 recombinase RecR [Bacillus anthracis]